MQKRKVSLEELKSIELDILQNIHDFCESENLTYFLSSGTLLGAIRHKGFIPWDDDADVMMPRPDYEKFIKLYKSENYILNYPGKKGYYQSIIKLAHKDTELVQRIPLADKPIGIHVDILPLDGESDNINKFVDHETFLLKMRDYSLILRQMRFNRLFDVFFSKRCFVDFLYYCYIRLIKKMSLKNIFSRIEQYAQKYSYETSNYVGYITMSNYRYKQRHRKILFQSKELVEFEGRKFYAPNGWSEYLTNLFGDYMQLPPEENRRSQHVWVAYWK